MKHGNRIITLFLAVAIAFVFCVPTLITPAHAVSLNQVASDTSITLNNGDVLRVPSEAISGNFIVYRVNNGAYRYYVIDVFESTDGVKELAFLSFTRYVGQSAITNANALTPNVWTIFGMQNVLYAISGAITVRPMYSTFDYYDAFGFLLIGGVGTEHTEDEFAGTFEVSTPDYTFRLPRELMGNQFMIVKDPAHETLDLIKVISFPDYESGKVFEGAFVDYQTWTISGFSLAVSFYGKTFTIPTDKFCLNTPYLYVYSNMVSFDGTPKCYAIFSTVPFVSTDTLLLNKYPASSSLGYFAYRSSFNASDGSFTDWSTLYRNSSFELSSPSFIAWTNVDVKDKTSGAVTYSPSSNLPYQRVDNWEFVESVNTACTFVASGLDILYSTFDYYDANGNLLYGNSFAGEVTEDDSLIDLTLDDGTLIRVPEHFGERDARYVVIDPVGGTEETAYLIYEFDYYEGVADGTICDFTRWYGVFSDGVWSWNYQEYYVTELDILDYGPIVYSTFEYVDGRVDEEEPPGSGGATSEEVKGFWDKLMAKLEEILKAIKGIGGTDLSISIENNTIIDAADKDPFDPEVYKGVVKTLRNSVKLFTGFFGFIYDGVNNFIDFLTDTSSEFYGIFHVNGMG